MLVTAWILFIFFSFILVTSTVGMGSGRVTSINRKVYFFTVFMVAITAGVIWGGLFQ